MTYSPNQVMVCVLCNGEDITLERCGCGGTCTVDEAIIHFNCELEILDK